jgi:hypothetical protein
MNIAGNAGIVVILMIMGITNSQAQNNKFVSDITTIITQDKGKELLRQCSRPAPKKVQEYFNLAQKDVDTLQLYFKKVLLVKTETGKKVKNLNTYGYQYLGLIIKDKKYIYINAFFVKTPQDLFTKFKDWKTYPVIACKGGKSFWGVLFDLEDCTFSQLEINDTKK